MSDTLVNRIGFAGVATGAAAGLGYLAQASYLPKTALNYIGRTAMQLPHFALAGGLGALGYTVTEAALKHFKVLPDTEKGKDKEGKDVEGSTNFGRHAVAVLTGVAVSAATGYGLATAGLVTGAAATAVAAGFAAVAAGAIVIHLLARAIFFALFTGDDKVLSKKPQENSVEKLKAEKETCDQLVATLEKKAALAQAKKVADEKAAALTEANKKLADTEAQIQKLNDDVASAENDALYKGKTLTALEQNAAIWDSSANKAIVRPVPADPTNITTKEQKAIDAWDAATKAVSDFKAVEAKLDAAKKARDHADTGVTKLNAQLPDLKKAAADAIKPAADAKKEYEDLAVKASAEKAKDLADKLAKAKDVQKKKAEELKAAEDAAKPEEKKEDKKADKV